MRAQTVPAPDPCVAPVVRDVSSEANIFTEEQEDWLGDILNENFRRDYNFIDDPEQDFLQHLGERLLRQLPASKINYRFIIVDFPESNSFSIGGGRIYVSRSLIAMTQSEDELAGVLGHEIGHVITHQVGIDISRLFREVLGTTEIKDRSDLLEKWNRMLDTGAKKHISFNSRQEEKNQSIADRIGMYAMTRAGYRTGAYTEFFDRLAETKGNKGNFWTDLFGTTSDDSKRLRALTKNPVNLPAGCISALPEDTNASFDKWRREIIESDISKTREQVPGLLRKVNLKPTLRDDLRQIIFSPNGKYLLAQDGTTIFVLTREPFANLFHIEAQDSNAAQFTPDSRGIVFYDKELRVQMWNIEQQKRVSVQQISTPCARVSLSPTGGTLACLSEKLDLQLIDVNTGSVLASRKKLFEVRLGLLEFFLSPEQQAEFAVRVANLRFSPDGRYFLGGHEKGAFGYDVANKAELKLPSKVRELVELMFTFVGPDEILGMGGSDLHTAMRVQFSTGQVLEQFHMDEARNFTPTGNPGYLLVSPVPEARVGIMDLSTKHVQFMYKLAGLALYGDSLVAEHLDGQISMHRWSDKQLVSAVQLPDSPLGEARAAAFSADGDWLALSSGTRAGVWKVDTGERAVSSRSFEGAWFDPNGLVAKFNRFEKDPARVVRFNTGSLAAASLHEYPAPPEKNDRQKLDEAEKEKSRNPSVACSDVKAIQFSDVLANIFPDASTRSDTDIVQVCDLLSLAPLWQRKISHERPRLFYAAGTGLMATVLGSYQNIQEAAKSNPDLQRRLDAIQGREGKRDSYLVQVLRARTGDLVGSILVDTGNLSFTVRRAYASGDFVFVSDSKNRTMAYSLKSGEQTGKVFGRVIAISPSGDRVLIENNKGDAQLYESATMHALAHFAFPAWITVATFLPDDKTLMVLTSDQVVYKLDAAIGKPAVAEKASSN